MTELAEGTTIRTQVDEVRSKDGLEARRELDRRREIVEMRSTKNTRCDGRRCEEVNDVDSKKDGLFSRAVHLRCPVSNVHCPLSSVALWTRN